MSGEYHGNIFLPGGVVRILEDGNVEINMHDGHTLTSEEFAAVAQVNDVLARLRNGKFVDYSFNVKSFEDSKALVKCEWTKRNNLVIRGPAIKEYDHADSVAEALTKHRTFTCTQAISVLIPKHREYTAVAE